MTRSLFLKSFLASLALASAALAQAPAFKVPDDITYRKADIISEGTRMHAEVYAPKSAPAGKKLPIILMAHGWGGTVAALRREAMAFAQAGYFVTAFDYRGWGESDSRVILNAPAPKEKKDGKFTAEVREVREVVDPIDFGTDWLNAIHWLAGEPQADMDHLGLWGSSFSGGLILWAAERDHRVKAIHSQVGAMDGRPLPADPKTTQQYLQEATAYARGEKQYPAPGAREVGNLRGAPIRSKMLVYTPVDEVDRAPDCAMQFMIAEKEELFDNKDHALKAFARHKGPKNLITVPNITHYGIYTEARLKAQAAAIAWFDKYLK
ncbi:MAG: alpha/beta fold hydrolase [Bryobacteraceae bacterium]